MDFTAQDMKRKLRFWKKEEMDFSWLEMVT